MNRFRSVAPPSKCFSLDWSLKQVVVQQHESQEVLRQKSEGVTQEQSLGLSSQGQLIDQESNMVDFPGLDTATIENIGGYSFMHDSEVTEG